MPIGVVCDKCGRPATFADNDAGLAVSCLGCRRTLRVPIKPPAPKVAPVLIQTAPELRAPGTPPPAKPGQSMRALPEAPPRITGPKPPSKAAPAKASAPVAASPTRPKPSRLVPIALALLIAAVLALAGIKVYSHLTNPANPDLAAAATTSTSQPATTPTSRPADPTPPAPAPAPAPPAAAQTPAPLGLIGFDSIDLHGTLVVDAYDSATGQYDEARAAQTAAVASNGPIRMGGDARVLGSLRPGPRDPLKPTKHAKVTGSTAPLDAPLPAPPIDVAALAAQATRSPDLPPGVLTNGSLVLAGKRAVAIPPGVYDLTDLVIDARATLRCDGPVTFLVRGRLTILGTIETHLNRPANLRIRLPGPAPAVLACRELHADLYAPGATVDVTGTGHFYGSLVARALHVSGKRNVHLDQSLRRD